VAPAEPFRSRGRANRHAGEHMNDAARSPSENAPAASSPSRLGAFCPLCAGASERLFSVHGHWIRRCRQCGHRYAEIEPSAYAVERIYGDAYFRGGGAGYADYLAEAHLLRAHGARYARLVARHAPPGRVLDVGAAAGFLLEPFVAGGWSAAAIEPNRAMADLAAARLGVPVYCATLDDLPRGAGSFDLVLMLEVIAHFVDVRASLAAAARHTRPGGLWLIETWDRESWTARLFGARWHEYNPPSVLHWFSRRALVDIGAGFGFRAVASGRPRKRLAGCHATSLLAHHYPASRLAAAAARAIPSRLAVPYPFDDVFWLLLRKDD
jgi:SAM-dependent methyltransferase